jgi:hypothetical protein
LSHFILNIIQISGIRVSLLLVISQSRSPTRSGYRELGLELVSLEDKLSLQPKRPPMAEEKRDDKEGDPFKTFLKESLMRQRNEMMENFAQILRRLSMVDQGIFDKQPFQQVRHPSRYKSILISPYLKAR